ncbi:hypothetical protein WN51_11906 [Melipona quadrifasciata]|uniref:Uncharacterized protein n=1 Tax=Melipona quadrifasciata TaxID=166423 RepID=A0A0M9A498_9HYME|nr:hypothetical protein WN51_11906 [Melipona quadrifasciata]
MANLCGDSLSRITTFYLPTPIPFSSHGYTLNSLDLSPFALTTGNSLPDSSLDHPHETFVVQTQTQSYPKIFQVLEQTFPGPRPSFRCVKTGDSCWALEKVSQRKTNRKNHHSKLRIRNSFLIIEKLLLYEARSRETDSFTADTLKYICKIDPKIRQGAKMAHIKHENIAILKWIIEVIAIPFKICKGRSQLCGEYSVGNIKVTQTCNFLRSSVFGICYMVCRQIYCTRNTGYSTLLGKLGVQLESLEDDLQPRYFINDLEQTFVSGCPPEITFEKIISHPSLMTLTLERIKEDDEMKRSIIEPHSMPSTEHPVLCIIKYATPTSGYSDFMGYP